MTCSPAETSSCDWPASRGATHYREVVLRTSSDLLRSVVSVFSAIARLNYQIFAVIASVMLRDLTGTLRGMSERS